MVALIQLATTNIHLQCPMPACQQSKCQLIYTKPGLCVYAFNMKEAMLGKIENLGDDITLHTKCTQT